MKFGKTISKINLVQIVSDFGMVCSFSLSRCVCVYVQRELLLIFGSLQEWILLWFECDIRIQFHASL